MSQATVVVLPPTGDSAQGLDQDRTDIASTIERALYERQHPTPEQAGPIKKILANQDSLYRYINWEDPLRTLSCYIGALGVLFGAHYLPLTQVALKAGLTTLGVVSFTEFTSRLLSDNSLSARLRPREYKKFPEPILNATLKDVHDLAQHTVLQAQRILYGEDLEKTFIAFLSCTTLFWLVKILSPFWLAIMALTSVFISPLLPSVFNRRVLERTQAVAGAAVQKGQEMTGAAVERGQEMTGAAVEKGQQLTGAAVEKGQQLTGAAVDKGQQLTGAAVEKGQQISGAAIEKGQQFTTVAVQKGQQLPGAAVERGQELARNGTAQAKHLSDQTKDVASNLSGSINDSARKMPQSTGQGVGHGNNSYNSHNSHEAPTTLRQPEIGQVRVAPVAPLKRAAVANIVIEEGGVAGSQPRINPTTGRNSAI